MRIIISVLVTIVLLAGTPLATQSGGDVCHVYIWDIEVAKKTAENFKPSSNREQDAKALQAALTIFPTFETRIEEEVFTTKHFRFPQGNLTITASVYYTDESMGRKVDKDKLIPADSITLGLALTNKAEENALLDLNDNAVAEVAYDDNTSKVRVKKQVMVGKRKYLIGLECDCNT